jgi:ABC-2 type transport system permease protein
LHSPNQLMEESASAVVFVGLILAFAGLLLMGHEYRYNTIMYTLTASNRRLKVLAAKLVVISVFAVATSLLMAFFSPLSTIVGTHLHGYHLAPQHFDYRSIIWHCMFVGWGYGMYAFILITIMRNQVGAIVTFLLIPLIGENILGHIFQGSSKYFPFTSLQNVLQHINQARDGLSVGHSAEVSLAYIAVGLIVGSVLFTRRDAN